MRFTSNLFCIFLILFLINSITYAQLNGTYTIKPSFPNFTGNPYGAGGKNYSSLNNAVNALKAYGISGQVVFNIDSGSYNEHIAIPQITGATANRSIVFQSQKNDSSSVLIYYNANNIDSNYVVLLDGADYVKFYKLSFKATGKTYSRVFDIKNEANNNTVSNCYLSSETGSGNTLTPIYAGTTTKDCYNTIENNYITGGDRGIYFNSNVSSIKVGNLISNNYITNFTAYGIYLYNQDTLKVYKNTIISTGTQNSVYGIYANYCKNNSEIANNKIAISGGYNTNGMYLYRSDNILVYNNFISVEGQNTNNLYGIYLSYPTNNKIYFNSVHIVSSTTSSSYCIIISGSVTTGSTLMNNIFSNLASGYSIYVSTANALSGSDHNNFYANGSYFAYYTSSRNSLTAWQLATGYDKNSYSQIAGFYSNTDLHTNNYLLDNKGISISSITTDIDGQPRSSSPDIGADEFIPIPNDAGVSQLYSPQAFCEGTNDIYVKVKNYGYLTLSTVHVDWKVNGVSQYPVFLNNLNLYQYEEKIVYIGSYSFSKGTTYTIKVWTSLPDNKADSNFKNDTTTINNVKTAMSGTFIVGKNSATYPDLSSAVTALIEFGVCAPVIFRIQQGTYNEQISIPAIKGASSTNTITFESYDKDSTKVEIFYNPGASASTYVIQLDGADFITFRYLTFKTNTILSTTGKIFNLINGAENNMICNNKLLYQSNGNTGTSYVIYSSSIVNNNINTIKNNTIEGGSYAIYLYNSTTNFERQNCISNNTISNFEIYAIFASGQSKLEISGNTIKSGISTNNQYGIYLLNCTDSLYIFNNQIRLKGIIKAIGISLNSCTGTVTHINLIYNNFILLNGTYSVTSYGIYSQGNTYTNICYNTVRLEDKQNNLNIAMFLSNGGNNFLFNNIFSNFGSGLAISAQSNSISSSNYNDLFTKGIYLAIWNSNSVTNLNDWKSITGLDNNSISEDPIFLEPDNYLVGSVFLDSTATPLLSYVTKDIEGETRNTVNPDIGVDEFSVYEYNMMISTIGDMTIPCNNIQIPIKVKVINLGKKVITSFKLKWSINNNSMPSKYFSCYLTANKDTEVVIGDYTFFKGNSYFVKVWLDTINTVLDQYAKNDTLSRLFKTGMSGVYSIGKSGRDFNTISEAINELADFGVCGKVIFEIDTGTFNEQLLIPAINGTSATNTVTFRSVSSDSTQTIITYQAISASDNFILRLFGADYIIFEHLTLKTVIGGTYGKVVEFKGGSDNNVFQGNVIESNGTSSNSYGFYFDASQNINIYNSIIGNNISGGYSSIYITGKDINTPAQGIKILKNKINSFIYYGIYANYPKDLNIEENTITSTCRYGVYISNGKGINRVVSNKLNLNIISSGYGFYLSYISGTDSTISLFANNFLYMYGTTSSSCSGYYISNSAYINIFHNTINYLLNGNTNSAVFNFTSASSGAYGNIVLSNNLIVNNSNSYIFNITSNAITLGYLKNSDFNIFYNSSQYFAQYGTQKLTGLENWRMTSGKDANSKIENPLFVSESDLHLRLPELYRINNPLKDIQTDIDLQYRSPIKPVAGADDIAVFPNDLSIVKLINPKIYVCEGAAGFYMKVKNEGFNDIDSFDVLWRFNGFLNKTYHCKFRLSHLQEYNIFLGIDTFDPAFINDLYIELVLPPDKTDDNPENNVLYISKFLVYKIPYISRVINDTICKNTDARLEVRGNAKKYSWYEDFNSNLPFHEDSVLIIKNLTHSKTFYVEAAAAFGVPDSVKTFITETSLQNMGNMFCVKAIGKDIHIDSFGFIPNIKQGIPIPMELYYKKGSYRGFESDSLSWTLLAIDTIPAKSKYQFTNMSFKGINIKAGDSISFYLTSTNPNILIYSTEGSKNISNNEMMISSGNMSYYPFDPYFSANKTINGIIYYSSGSFCHSNRIPVYAHVNPVPDVNFGSDTTICRNEKQFLDAGTGPGFNYIWKFNNIDDTIFTGHKLFLDSSGLYAVTVSDTCGFTSYDQIQINLIESPEASFKINKIRQCKKENIFSFSNNSVIDNGKLVSYYWNFGDGNYSLAENPSHHYSFEGEYSVFMICTSEKGCKDTFRYDNLAVLPSPLVSFTVDGDTQCRTGNFFNFNNQSTINSGHLIYRWYFGDGAISDQKNAYYTYKYSGSYQVMLVATSTEMCRDTAYHTVVIKPSPYVNLGNDTVLKSNQKIVLRAGKGYDAYLWSGGEKSDTLVVTSKHPDLKLIWVNVIWNGCYDNDTIIIGFDTVIGIRENDLPNFFYPNPAYSKVFFKIPPQADLPLTLFLFDKTGKEILKHEINSNDGFINLENLAKGIYLLKLQNKNNVYLHKFLKL